MFVHGIGADYFDLWFLAVAYLKTQGYGSGDITLFHYPSLDGAAPAAEQLAREVDWLRAHSGQGKVDIVSHSFGSLVTKLCIVEGGCKGKVARWESLAGANNGTQLDLGASPSALDVRTDSPLVTRLQARDDEEIAAQGVAVQVQWTPSDLSILPPTLSQEPYADNVVLPASITHQSVLFDPDVLRRTHLFLTRESTHRILTR